MNPSVFFSLLCLAMAAGVSAYVFIVELTAPKMLFNGYLNWLSKAIGPEARARGKEKPWLFKPLGGCVVCFSGQVGLWSYLFSLDLTVRVFPVTLLDYTNRTGLPVPVLAGFHVGHLAFTVCACIFTTCLISLFYRQTRL